ncbi:MAG: hypothetical protein J5529_05520 [Prevotella sp.]|nr:hypothetical protein [Prevotella sp.]
MAYKRFQNIFTESKIFLPLSIAVAGGACYLYGVVEGGWWMQLACLAISTILLAELNSSHQLIRVSSHATPSMFLLLVAAAIFIVPDLEAEIMMLCFIALHFMLFHSQQRKVSPGWVFYGFFCLGLASMVFVQALYYVPLLWVLMAACLRAFTAKTFWASVLGLFTPYWLAGPAIVYLRGTEVAARHFIRLRSFAPLGDYSMFGEHEWLAIGWTAFLALIGIIHYANQGYQDKLRTRLLHEIFITIDLATFTFLALQPQHYKLLLGVAIANTSPLIAHYLTLTHTWLTNISFYFIILGTLAIIAYNTWTPSSNFLSTMATLACSYLPL